jgi:hypothetical protein
MSKLSGLNYPILNPAFWNHAIQNHANQNRAIWRNHPWLWKQLATPNQTANFGTLVEQYVPTEVKLYGHIDLCDPTLYSQSQPSHNGSFYAQIWTHVEAKVKNMQKQNPGGKTPVQWEQVCTKVKGELEKVQESRNAPFNLSQLADPSQAAIPEDVLEIAKVVKSGKFYFWDQKANCPKAPKSVAKGKERPHCFIFQGMGGDLSLGISRFGSFAWDVSLGTPAWDLRLGELGSRGWGEPLGGTRGNPAGPLAVPGLAWTGRRGSSMKI